MAEDEMTAELCAVGLPQAGQPAAHSPRSSAYKHQKGIWPAQFLAKGFSSNIEYVFIRVHSAKAEQFQFAALTLLIAFILTVGGLTVGGAAESIARGASVHISTIAQSDESKLKA